MKKRAFLCAILALALLLSAPCASAAPEDWKGKTLSNFTVDTIDGAEYTLAEALMTHELVLINLWATWCGPCRMEFPALESAWEKYGDRVHVIALSIEKSDTFDVLRSFAEENDLNFAIGRDESDLFGTLGGSAIPTTLIVNRDRQIVAVEIGAKTSEKEFTALFDSLLGQSAEYHGADRCVLIFRDVNGKPIQGVAVGFCNGEYDEVKTDKNGRVTFGGEPSQYHVHLLSVPDGYAKPWEQLYIEGEEYELTVTLYPD